jgi:hypothetical protein
MEGDFSNLSYSSQEKHDLEWGYYIMNFVPGAWDALADESITKYTNFSCFFNKNKEIEGIINHVVFNLNEFTVGMVMRTMLKIARYGWDTYKKERELCVK